MEGNGSCNHDLAARPTDDFPRVAPPHDMSERLPQIFLSPMRNTIFWLIYFVSLISPLLEAFSGSFRWKLSLEAFAGSFRWKLSLEAFAGSFCWKLVGSFAGSLLEALLEALLETLQKAFAGSFRWKLSLEAFAGSGSLQRPILQACFLRWKPSMIFLASRIN